MRHYHGTPIGGTRAGADEFATGRHLLIPWKRPEDLPRALHLSRGFIVDNSAFSFWTNGEEPNWPEYMRWIRPIARHPRFDFAMIPDVIDGSEQDNDDLIKRWDKFAWHPVHIEGCPVWHLHESLERLDKLCSGRWRHVALGSSGQWPNPGVGAWWNRMIEAFNVICDNDWYPRVKIHGLRMLRGDIIHRFPFASADSTNAVQNGVREAQKNGVDATWGKLTLARRIEMVQSPSKWVEADIQKEFELVG